MDKLLQIPMSMLSQGSGTISDESNYAKDLILSLINSDIYKSNSNLRRFLYALIEMKKTIKEYNVEYENEARLNLLSILDEINFLNLSQKLFLTSIITKLDFPIDKSSEKTSTINEDIGHI